MASIEHSFNMNMDVTAPPTPDQERSFSQVLKRSASTASLLSPPASVRKPSAKRLRTQLSTLAADESIHGDYLGRKQHGNKRSKAKGMKAKAAPLRPAVTMPTTQQDFNFVLKLSEGHEAKSEPELPPRPVTPPPRLCTPLPACPQTPPRTKPQRSARVSRDAPLRDSPNNPFLVESLEPPAMLRLRPKRSATDFTEGPTVGYVFRGVPTVFANPYASQHPPSPTKDKNHPSFLPLEHPDFSPCELARPQLLFPEAHGYAREGSPCPCIPSTPKRGRSRAPRTPIRRSQRSMNSVDFPKPVMMEPEQACGPKTPEPKTPQMRTRMKNGTAASTAAVAAEVRVMRTRSKTAAQVKAA
ncbi:unnamed protein product [Rhizoctonia solani]|uniref:Uncharacterized protein n=1 Tax=Rhizoctonia solani TaxID=456999 RepID=A0A8H2WER2_9AGAM|nr:unnamed protein product [Rhizoctonia solani]